MTISGLINGPLQGISMEERKRRIKVQIFTTSIIKK